MKTVGLFVDITNQYYSAMQTHHGGRIDYAKYLDVASRGYNVYRSFAFGAQMSDEATSFISVLKNIGFETRYRKATIIGDRPDIRHTDRNMAIAMEIWRIINKVDVIVLGTNDPDIAPLVQRIKEVGVQVIVFSCNISQELKDVADRCIEIDFSLLERKMVPA